MEMFAFHYIFVGYNNNKRFNDVWLSQVARSYNYKSKPMIWSKSLSNGSDPELIAENREEVHTNGSSRMSYCDSFSISQPSSPVPSVCDSLPSALAADITCKLVYPSGATHAACTAVERQNSMSVAGRTSQTSTHASLQPRPMLNVKTPSMMTPNSTLSAESFISPPRNQSMPRGVRPESLKALEALLGT